MNKKQWAVGDWIRMKVGAPTGAGLIFEIKELDLEGHAVKVGEATTDERLWFWTGTRWIEML